ncbi:MAG: hypothetical protein E7350_00520 [Clostridiales bacterium]|nr:hypothetical protein [Clostridiales bacterium]
MNSGEFYNAKEHNHISEYRHFPAEIYKKPIEENEIGNELAHLGQEATTLQKTKKNAKSNGDGAKTIMDKLFNTIKSVATTATVAIAAVAVVSTIATTPPKVELVSLDAGSDYVEYEMTVGDLAEDGNYSIVISTTNEESVLQQVEENGTYSGRVDGLKPSWEYTLSFVSHDSSLGDITHFRTKFQTDEHVEQQPNAPPVPPITPPDFTVLGVSVVGLNKIDISFAAEDLDENIVLSLATAYDGQEAEIITLSPSDISKGYVRLTVSEYTTSMTVTPTATILNTTGGESIIEYEPYSHTFDSSLDLDVTVRLTDGNIVFYYRAISRGATHISISGDALGGEDILEEIYDSYYTLYYSEEGELSYTVCLTDENGTPVLDSRTVTVDTSLQTDYEYDFSYTNPGEVAVTYNEDGTVNFYTTTQFQTDHEELYYQVMLGDYRFRYTEPVMRAENLPNTTYPLRYDICFDLNGIQYSIYSVYPSGAVNESNISAEYIATILDNAVELTIYDYANSLDLSNVRLVGSNGEEITLTESSFVYSEEDYSYSASVQFSDALEYVTLYLYADPHKEYLESIGSYKGTSTLEISEIFYLEMEDIYE